MINVLLSLISSFCLFTFSACILSPAHLHSHPHTCTHTHTRTHTSPLPHSLLQRICPPSPWDPGPLPGGVVSLDGEGLCLQHEAVDGAVPLPPQQCPGLHQHLSAQPHSGRGGCQWTGTDGCTVTEVNRLQITLHVHIWSHTTRTSHSCGRFCVVSLLNCVEPTVPADGCGTPWCGVGVVLLGVGGRGTPWCGWAWHCMHPCIGSSACALIVCWGGSSLHACVLLPGG